jgi:hypothetical protein
MIDVTVDNGYGSQVVLSGDSSTKLGFSISLRTVGENNVTFVEGFDRDNLTELVKAILTLLAIDDSGTVKT